jgi:glycosyltransferase involved in cell wall biosynthesis
MRVLMLGWEFPPYISGGLGTACLGLTRALAESGVEVIFVLPRSPEGPLVPRVRFLGARPRPRTAGRRSAVRPKPVEFVAVASCMRPYAAAEPASAIAPAAETPVASAAEPTAPPPVPGSPRPGAALYAGDVFEAVERYAEAATEAALRERFDLVHAHDWMTFAAGRTVAERSGRPLIVQVHSTEFDRSGLAAHPEICAAEERGCRAADRVIAVSRAAADAIAARYGVSADRLRVIHNAVLGPEPPPRPRSPEPTDGPKRVLFLGRITRQKGPGYFLWAARKLLDRSADARFVMAGDGDLLDSMRRLADELGLAGRVEFPGFLSGAAVSRAFRRSDLFIMPSVCEPFGIAALEAMLHGVPAIVSRQAGVCEVADAPVGVDFWDTDGIAAAAERILTDPAEFRRLSLRGLAQARACRWSAAAARLIDVYRELGG